LHFIYQSGLASLCIYSIIKRHTYVRYKFNEILTAV
jgi:hypothetical protein